MPKIKRGVSENRYTPFYVSARITRQILINKNRSLVRTDQAAIAAVEAARREAEAAATEPTAAEPAATATTATAEPAAPATSAATASALGVRRRCARDQNDRRTDQADRINHHQGQCCKAACQHVARHAKAILAKAILAKANLGTILSHPRDLPCSGSSEPIKCFRHPFSKLLSSPCVRPEQYFLRSHDVRCTVQNRIRRYHRSRRLHLRRRGTNDASSSILLLRRMMRTRPRSPIARRRFRHSA